MSLFFALMARVPRRLAAALLRAVCWLLFVLGVRRRYALEGLARAFPELPARERRRLARRNYLHLGACAADFLRSPSMPAAELERLVDPGDWEKVEPLLRAKRGFIVATAHFGNFELFGVWAARRNVPLAILTRALKGRFNAGWVGHRALAGIREIHRGWTNLFASVERGEVLALLIDQNMLAKRAVFAPFFGTLAATTPAPAVVAERTGAPVFLAFMLRNPDGTYRTTIEGPFTFERRRAELADDVRAFTAMLNERLEHYVRAHPDQWFWMHRRWKTRPPESLPSRVPGLAAAQALAAPRPPPPSDLPRAPPNSPTPKREP